MTKKADAPLNPEGKTKTVRQPKQKADAVETQTPPEVFTGELEKVSDSGNEIKNQLAKFNLADSAINQMIERSKGLELNSLEDREKFEKAKALLKEFVSSRNGLDTKRKEIYKPYQEIVDQINAEAKRLNGLMSPTEIKLKAEVDKFIAWEKEEAEKVKKQAEQKLKDRVKELEGFGLKFNEAYYVCGDISMDIATIQNLSDTDFLVLGEKVKVAKKKIDDEENARLAKEALEKKEREETQAKLDAQAKKNEEEAKKLEEQKIKNDEEIAKMRIENRGFKLEAIGATGDDATFHFKGESDSASLEKTKLGQMDEEQFKIAFEKFQKKIKTIQDADKILKENREKEAKEKAEQEAKDKIVKARVLRLEKMGFVKGEQGFLNFENLACHLDTFSNLSDELFEDWANATQETVKKFMKDKADSQEIFKQSQLPEIEKLEKYIKDLTIIVVPKLQNESINQVLSDLKNDLKLATDRALKSIENIKK